jgi:hypothetical protein
MLMFVSIASPQWVLSPEIAAHSCSSHGARQFGGIANPANDR